MPFVGFSQRNTFERHSAGNTLIQLSQEPSEESISDAAPTSKRRKRSRRKVDSIVSESLEDTVEETVTEEEPSEEVSIGQSSTQFVEMEIPDIRSIASGGTALSEDSESEEYEYYDDDEEEGNSLDGLLADAKRLRASREEKEEDEEFNIGPVIKNVISTVVTVDFFIVLALLAWFLAGIFGSYVLKNDAVQLAFNGIFEPVVQPALGILMIASAAGGAMGGGEKD